ncbi:MAG: type 1 glutamine amidotransferase [Pseudomonadota bacterium]
MKRLKLGILQVNHDRSIEVGDAFPDDAHRFRDLFDAQDQRFAYRVYMTIGGEVPRDVDEQDAYLITGSPLSVLDDHAFLPPLYDFIRRCDEARKPLLGVCFGHQAIAVALGGTVERTHWNVGIEQVQFVQNDLTGKTQALHLYQFHHDAVTDLPDTCTLIGTSPGAPVAAMAKDSHILTVQAHPEFTDPFMRCVLDYTKPHLEPETYAAARETLDLPNDGPVFARIATTFFGGTP